MNPARCAADFRSSLPGRWNAAQRFEHEDEQENEGN